MLLDESQVVQAHHIIVLSNIIHPDDSRLVEQLSLKKGIKQCLGGLK